MEANMTEEMAGSWIHIGPGVDDWICIGGGTAEAPRIDWWKHADPLDDDQVWPWQPATRAEVEALQEPHACLAVLGFIGATAVRSSSIPVAGGVQVRLWTVGPWETALCTVQAPSYHAVLREVETRLEEIAAMAAARLRDGVTRLELRDLLALREALRAG